MTAISYAGQYDASSASAAHVDPVARTFIAQISPAPGVSIAPGEGFFLAGRFWKNRTDDAITIPNDTGPTGLKNAGFYEADEFEDGVADITIDAGTNMLRTRFLNPNTPDILTDLSSLDEFAGVYDTYADIPDEGFALGMISVVSESSAGHPKGVYQGNGLTANLVLSDDTNTYDLTWKTEGEDYGILELYENGLVIKEIEFPFTSLKVHEVLAKLEDITDYPDNSLYFVTEGTDDNPRGVYYKPLASTDDPVLYLALPEDRPQFFGSVEMFDDIDATGKLENVLTIVTIGDDTNPPGLYVGNGTEAILKQPFHQEAYRGYIEQYDDATDYHKVPKTFTIVTEGTRDKPRGIYQGVKFADGSTDIELVLSLSSKPPVMEWIADDDSLDPGDIFIMPDLYSMERPRLFRVPSSWEGGTDSTGADWDEVEQNRYEDISRDLPFPTGNIMVEEVVETPYPTADSTWAIDVDNHRLLLNVDSVWQPYPMEAIPDGAYINVKNDSRNWYYDAPTSEIVLIPPPPQHVYLHHVPVNTVTEMKALQIPDGGDDSIIFVKETRQLFRYHNTDTAYWNQLILNGYEFEVHEADDGNGTWVEEYHVSYKPLTLRPVANVTELKEISRPDNGSVCRVENTDTVYEFYKGDIADGDGEIADDTGTGTWHPIDVPANHPHLRLDPVNLVSELKAIEAVDFMICKVLSKPNEDTVTGLTNVYVFRAETPVATDTDSVIADDEGTGNWHVVPMGAFDTFNQTTSGDSQIKCKLLPYQTVYVTGVNTQVTMPPVGENVRVTISDTSGTTLVVLNDDDPSTVVFDNGVATDTSVTINQPHKQVHFIGLSDKWMLNS